MFKYFTYLGYYTKITFVQIKFYLIYQIMF